ncbi:SRPBCC family protein [Nocardioides sp. B-3]|uniref:SRPBCC family protein n=1 Tax=Nocardioides sp. B-3 TaxID=2895565 RepID=UPI0021528B1A|nr:SRPBCC family protein [Nocardioides sp. B-3]UUZ59022.1 SRPBCC family protein [Nocardioides sp. B-3]
MELNNTFTVPVPIEEAWLALLDIERVATCVPGASPESLQGDEFTGSVRVKLGPVQMTYKGKATFVERDESAFRAVISASGKESKGAGTARARITTPPRGTGGRDRSSSHHGSRHHR